MAVRYAVACVYCEETVLTMSRIEDDDLRALVEHLRRDHPETLNAEPTPDFARIITHFRLMIE